MSQNSQVSLQSLNVLIRTAKHPDIPHMDALMRELFGQKATTIKIFKRLIRWLPYAKRADGAVYKSAKELAKEVACSPKSVVRARKLLESVGFDIFLKKANGAPTNHYILNLERLLSKLASVFDATRETIMRWLQGEQAETISQPKSPNPTVQADPMDSTQGVPDESVTMSQSITLKDTKSTAHKEKHIDSEAVVDLDRIFEIEAIRETLQTTTSMVQSWVYKHGIKRVRDVVNRGIKEKSTGRIRKSLVGWIRKALKDGYAWDTPASDEKEYLWMKADGTIDWDAYIKHGKYGAWLEA